MPVDPSNHLPLIYRVAGQMGIGGSDLEEAFSVGLVSITEAARKYDPAKNVPIANWLGRNIRWSLQSWRAENRRREAIEAPTEVSQAVIHNYVETASRSTGSAIMSKELPASLRLNTDSLEAYVAHRELCNAIRALPAIQRAVIVGNVIGYTGLELAAALHITPVAVSRAKKKAQARLREALK